MRDVWNRQQWLVTLALFSARAAAFPAASPIEDAAAREIVTLKLEVIALTARNAPPEEWKRMRANYIALAVRRPKSASVREAFGEFLWQREDYEGAVREWRTGEKLEPKNAAILGHLGAACLSRGEMNAALAYYLRAVEVRPEDAHTHFSLANIFALFRHERGRTEEESFVLALTHFAEAHRLAPGNADYARGYAETFYLMPRPDWSTALRVWEDYLNLIPQKDFALLNLTRVHLKMGNGRSARACLAQVSEAGNQSLKQRLAERIERELLPEKEEQTASSEKTLKPAIDDGEGRP